MLSIILAPAFHLRVMSHGLTILDAIMDVDVAIDVLMDIVWHRLIDILIDVVVAASTAWGMRREPILIWVPFIVALGPSIDIGAT